MANANVVITASRGSHHTTTNESGPFHSTFSILGRYQVRVEARLQSAQQELRVSVDNASVGSPSGR